MPRVTFNLSKWRYGDSLLLFQLQSEAARKQGEFAANPQTFDAQELLDVFERRDELLCKALQSVSPDLLIEGEEHPHGWTPDLMREKLTAFAMSEIVAALYSAQAEIAQNAKN